MAGTRAATGQAPVQQIGAADPPPGSLAFWWLGQAGFAIRGAGVTLLVDPFLGAWEGRQIEPPVQPAEFGGVDVVFCTHEHADHLNPDTVKGVAAALPAARIVVPRPVVGQVTALGVAADRVIGAQPHPEEPPLDFGPLRVYPVPARHGIDSPPATYGFGFEKPGSGGLCSYLGYVFELNGVRVYHAGDSSCMTGS
jgi:L-ascorbate metabolism protein UlaG (beta-lactamase superfamily)